MQINSLPIRRSDETLYSVAARTRLMNAAKDDRDACCGLFGNSRNTHVSDFPVNLIHFCAVTSGHFGTPQDVLNEMTLAEFFNRIGSHSWPADNSCLPLATTGYGLSTLSNGSTNTWRACAQCMESEMALNATAYWHCSHHLPTAFFCTAHNAPLSACISLAHERHNRFLLPEDTVLVNRLHRIDLAENRETLMRLTKLGIDVLHDTGKSIDPRTAHAAILNALNEHGLLTSSRMVRREPFFIVLSRYYWFLHDLPEFVGVISPQGFDVLHRSLQRGDSSRSALYNLLLIDWLFGTWRSFKEQCAWQAVMDRPCESQGPKVHPCIEEIPHASAQALQEMHCTERESHRKICLSFRDTNASAKRSRFARAAPKSFRWLLRYDSDWLNKSFPGARYSRMQGELF